MPIGQSNTVWFKELKEILKEKWRPGLTIPEHFVLVYDLNSKLNQIRKDGNMSPPMMWCPKCQKRERSGFLQVSIAGMYYALKGMEIISEDQFEKLIKDWKTYSRLKKINTYGNPIELKTTENKRNNNIHEA
jgi:hypothetical protein